MPDEIKRISKTMNDLPAEVQFYFGTEYSGQKILSLASKYKINPNLLYNLSVEAINSNFSMIAIKEGLEEIKKEIGPNERGAAADIFGQIFFPLKNYLKNIDVEQEVKRLGGDPSKYAGDVEEFSQLIEAENDRYLSDLEKLHQENFNEEEEKKYVINIFSDSLIDILKSEYSNPIIEFNWSLTYLLMNCEGYQEIIMHELLENGNIITSRRLTLGGSTVEPTIGNWLKDLIRSCGNEAFDKIILEQYFASSENVKNLKLEEKLLLRKLFGLYYNLNFFPESMSGKLIEDWEIIPVEKGSETPIRAKINKTQPITNKEKDKPQLIKNSEPKISDERTELLADLEKKIHSYSENSLEYKALSQEISRLKQAISKK